MAKEDYLLRLSILDQEARKIQEQIQIVNQQILDLEVLSSSLDSLNNEKEILANMGRGIFVKSKIQEKELFVNVGSGIVLKKTPEDTKKIIKKQIMQLEEIQKNLVNSVDGINEELQDLIIKAQKEK